MPKCQHVECSVTSPRRIQSDGYCEKHSLEQQHFDAKQEVAALQAENAELRAILQLQTDEILKLNSRMNLHSSYINTANYERDALEQYGRKENGRVIEVPEEPIQYDKDNNIVDNEDCTEKVIKAAELIGVTLDRKDIQRCHRVGKRRVPQMVRGKLSISKPRQIIVRFKDYAQRQEFITKKRNLQANAKEKNCEQFANAFIAEDLTPLRSKLLWYCKKQSNKKLMNCHTRDGIIHAQFAEDEKWITVSSPDDLFKHGIDVNIGVMNKGLYKMQILSHVESPNLSRALELLSA